MPHPAKPRRRFLFSNLSGSQEGWEVQACSDSPSIEQVYPVQAFQDGRNPHSQSSPEERGLHDKDRLEGRVFCRPSPLLTSETPVIPIEGQAYEFSCLQFGLVPAPQVFTKVLKPVVGFL